MTTMMNRLLTFVLAGCVALSAMLSVSAQDESGFDIGFEPVAEGFDQPVDLTHAGDGTGVLYVAEKPGTVRQIIDSERVETPFLDITDRVRSSGYEQGLLGIAFPPDYHESQLFYVHYSDLQGNTVISRFFVLETGLADAASEQVLLQVEQPYENHNGGQIAFGPDGYLYIALGDGGSGGDPEGNGQNPHTLLGSILRIDVDPSATPEGKPYAIPEDNPFVGTDDGLPEIYAWGLRNPWRFSFDAETGEAIIADVGQARIEEINILPVINDQAPNYGWNVMEGSECFQEEDCDSASFVPPVMEYTHDHGCSVTGGEVYYGENLPELDGTYIFGDFCTGLVWQGIRNDDGTWTMRGPVESGLSISSFGVDERGEIYVVDLNSGIVYRLEAPL